MPTKNKETIGAGPAKILLGFACSGDWSSVSRALQTAGALTPQLLSWAKASLDDSMDAARELAVRVLEASGAPLPPATTGRLLEMSQDDPVQFIRYQAAFALWKRGARQPQVEHVVGEALECPSLATRAKTHLQQKGQ